MDQSLALAAFSAVDHKIAKLKGPFVCPDKDDADSTGYFFTKDPGDDIFEDDLETLISSMDMETKAYFFVSCDPEGYTLFLENLSEEDLQIALGAIFGRLKFIRQNAKGHDESPVFKDTIIALRLMAEADSKIRDQITLILRAFDYQPAC